VARTLSLEERREAVKEPSSLPTSVNVKGSGTAGLSNVGFWGIDVRPQKYSGSLGKNKLMLHPIVCNTLRGNLGSGENLVAGRKERGRLRLMSRVLGQLG
jgi:hypothetical protein